MKLIDILVQELREWPKGHPCLWISDAHSAEVYGKAGGCEIKITGSWDCPEDYLTAIVYKNDWEAAIDSLKSKECTQLAWFGEGRPPAGIDFECADRVSDRWSVEHSKYTGERFIVCQRKSDGVEHVISIEHTRFRPVRTPEQIAEEARESTIKQFMQIGDIYYCDAEKLYDAGARIVVEDKP